MNALRSLRSFADLIRWSLEVYADMSKPPSPICINCGLSAENIAEYIDAANDENLARKVQGHPIAITPSEWVRENEVTYNPDNNRFCCTFCFITSGRPQAPFSSWRAV